MVDEKQIVDQLLGPMGGVFGLGIIVGVVTTWAVNLKIVSPFVRQAHEAEMKALTFRIEALEKEVARLRAIEEEHQYLLKEHSRRTLKLPEDH